MTKPAKPKEPDRIACEICLKEVPRSEAQVAEARDYIAHFCGLDCYELWKKQAGNSSRAPGDPGAKKP